MDERSFERKIFYSVTEVAEITGCHRGRVLRWIHRRQMAAVRLEDAPLVPLSALLTRLERIEASRARRRARTEASRAASSASRAEPHPAPGPDRPAGRRSEALSEPGFAAPLEGQSAGVSQTG
jgi:excisionase family DNA binding protein